MSLRRRWAGVLLGGLLLGGPAMARAAGGDSGTGSGRIFWGQDLYVPESQKVGSAVCLFCSVQIDGDVTGRVVVLFGNLSASGQVGGAVVVVGGNAVFDGASRVRGSTVVVGGNAVYESEQSLPGSVLVLGGHTSSFAARESVRRHLTVAPKLLSTLVLLGALLLMGAVVVLRRPRRA